MPFVETSRRRRIGSSRIIKAFASAALIASPAAMPADQIETIWNGGTGNWNISGNWTPAVIPNNSSDTYLVRIDGGKVAESVVFLNISPTIDGLELDADDVFTIGNQRILTIATDSVVNNGTWQLNHTAGTGTTRLQFTAPVTLQGSGEWVLSNSAGNRLGPLGGLTTLNSAGTLRGSGAIELGAHPFANQGLIRQENSIALTILNGAGGFTNTGELEAAGSGGLILRDGLFTNTGGTITALNGSFVQAGPLASFLGGTLDSAGTGNIRINSNSLAIGEALPIFEDVTNEGAVLQPNLQSSIIRGTITNDGTWTIAHTFGSGSTDLLPELGATLTGNGELIIGNNHLPRIVLDDSTFTHEANHTIRGTGQILLGDGSFTNRGIIRHTGGSPMTIMVGPGTFNNEGIVESIAGIGSNVLILTGGEFENSETAVIRSTATGITQLGPSASFTGGTLSTADEGVLRISSSSASTGDALPILNNLINEGVIQQPNLQSAIIRGTITNNGDWSTNHTGGSGSTNIYAESGAVLTGNGGIAMIGNALGRFMTDDSTITHDADHTLRGGGQIIVGDDGTLVNEGTIRQEGATSLTVNTGNTGALATLENQSLMEATGTGGLRLISATIENDGGLLRAHDTSFIQVGPEALVRNGTLEGVDTGHFIISSSSSTSGPNVPILEDLVMDTPITHPNLQSAIIRGTVTNNGQWTTSHTSGSGSTNVIAEQAAILNGTGSIHMSGNTLGRFISDGTVVTHEADHTIHGGGAILNGTGGMINRGTIRQEGTVSLTVTATELALLNEGLLTSNGSGRLILTNGPIVNTDGIIEAQDGGAVQIGPSGSITGGLVISDGTGGIFISGSGGNAPLVQDVTISGVVTQPNQQHIRLRGTVTNSAIWTTVHTAGSGNTDIVFEQDALLSGSGEVFMNGTTLGRIISDGTTAINEAGHTIRGRGQIMANTGGFINRGTVQAEGTSLTLSANVDGFLNEGDLIAQAASSLIIANGANFTNDGNALVETGATLTVTTGNYVQTGGDTQVNGTMTLTQAGSRAMIDGGVLSGTGIISRTVENSAFVLPGASGPGLLTINEQYIQDAAGTFVAEVGGLTPGVQHDRLVVVGAATIDGRLHVELVDDFVPSVGNEFPILTGLSVTGEFDVLSGALETEGVVLEAVYEVNQVKLVAVALDGLAVNDVHVTEGPIGTTDAVFTVSLTPANETQTVQVTVQTEDGTATVADNDYIPLGPTTLTFAPGETEKQVTVKVINDGKAEPEEYFKLVLSDPSNADLARAEGVAIIAESPEVPRKDWMVIY